MGRFLNRTFCGGSKTILGVKKSEDGVCGLGDEERKVNLAHEVLFKEGGHKAPQPTCRDTLG